MKIALISFIGIFYFVLAAYADETNNSTTETSGSTEDKSLCLQSKDRGDKNCENATGGLRFYYDTKTKHCQPFFYDGCAGNSNRFGNAEECRKACNQVPELQKKNSHQSLVLPVPKCEGGVRAAIDNSSNPIECDACPEKHSCKNGVCCPSKEHVCDLEYDTGKYATIGSHTPRYFYSKKVNNCLLFTYYGVLGNSNNFESYKECIKFCAKPKE